MLSWRDGCVLLCFIKPILESHGAGASAEAGQRTHTYEMDRKRATSPCFPSESLGWRNPCPSPDDDCCYFHFWRNNVVIAFETLSSSLT